MCPALQPVAGGKDERTTVTDRHVHVLLPVPDVRGQTFSDREYLQPPLRLSRPRQCGGLVEPEGRKHVPARGVHMLAHSTAAAECVDLPGVRLSCDQR